MENNVVKKSNKTVIIIVLLVLVIIGLVLYIMYGRGVIFKQNNVENNSSLKDNNQSSNPTTNDNENNTTNNNSVIDNKTDEVKLSFVKYATIDKVSGLYGAYSDGSSKLLTDVLNNNVYYLDNNILYYTDAKGDLHSVNINEGKSSVKSYEFRFQETYMFGAKNSKLYYFLKLDNGKIAAVTYDLVKQEENKNVLSVDYVYPVDFENGSIAYFNVRNNINNPSIFYSYNFETNELKRMGQYNYILENRENSILFLKSESQNSVCLFDKKSNSEKFCVNLSNYTQTNQVYDEYPVTIKDNSILLLTDNKIKECVSASDCNSVLYTLTSEEAKEPYKLILYYANRLVLTIGYDEVCEGGCIYKYKYYDITNGKKEIKIPYQGAEYNELHFIK